MNQASPLMAFQNLKLDTSSDWKKKWPWFLFIGVARVITVVSAVTWVQSLSLPIGIFQNLPFSSNQTLVNKRHDSEKILSSAKQCCFGQGKHYRTSIERRQRNIVSLISETRIANLGSTLLLKWTADWGVTSQNPHLGAGIFFTLILFFTSSMSLNCSLDKWFRNLKPI